MTMAGAPIASGLISLISVFLIKQRFGQWLLDVPNERSSHSNPTPRGGGLGFIIGFGLVSLSSAWVNRDWTSFFAVWSVLLPLAIIGILDDRFSLPSRVRYLVQLSSALIAVYWFSPFDFGGFESAGLFGYLVTASITVFGFTAFINFYNFMDGLDGLVAGTVAVQLIFLAQYLQQPVWWLLVAALLGFLFWNWSPAKIFMGDAGSTVLGGAVSVALLNGQGSTTHLWSAVAITLPLIADAIYTLIRRLRLKENIFEAHRSHIYQRLQQSGWSHRQVATVYIGINTLVGFAIYFAGIWGALFSLLGVLSCIAIAESKLQKKAIA